VPALPADGAANGSGRPRFAGRDLEPYPYAAVFVARADVSVELSTRVGRDVNGLLRIVARQAR
jgi:hypothetical protein